MENYKVLVKDEAESKEVQELFFELGAKWKSQLNRCSEASVINAGFPSIFLYGDSMALNWRSIEHFNEDTNFKELTIPQLKDIIVLKRNDVADATHLNNMLTYYKACDGWYYFDVDVKKWLLSTGGKQSYYDKLKPIEKTMKEYLTKTCSGKYKLTLDDGDIEIPEGAVKAYLNRTKTINFVNADDDFMNSATKGEWVDTHRGKHEDSGHVLFWSRHTLPETLPFIDDEPKYDPEETLNDKVATADVARQESITPFDTQISGDHYKLLPIQPMKFALANGLDYAQGNVIKYVIRHASKNGKDDLLKAIHNIELMIEHYYGDH